MDYRKQAKQFIDAGFSVIPVNETKQPAISRWGVFQITVMTNEEVDKHFKDCWGIALLCGGPWRVVALDFDLKYDLTETLFDRYKKEIPKELLKKMYVQTTMNKGYHFAFRAPATRLRGNEKLASRSTTAYERDQTYRDAFDDPNTRDKATKIANNDRSRVIVETRSGSKDVAGGYILVSPTPNYNKVYGKIQEITEEEYDLLMDTAKRFNEVRDLQKDKKANDNIDWEITPIDHYNEEGDIVQTLLDNGWGVVDETNKNIRFKRPGQTHSNSSAWFDKGRRTFVCYSTSCEFDTSKGYSPFGVYALLEHDNDFSSAYHALVNLEYGIKK